MGRNHPDVAVTLNNIAAVLGSQGDHVGALEKYHEALRIFERVFDRNHPKVAMVLNNIAGELEAQGDDADALEMYEESSAILVKFLNPDHPYLKSLKEKIQRARWQTLSETERWQNQTNFYLSQLNDTTSGILDTLKLSLLNRIGVGYIKQDMPDSALVFLSQALRIARQLDKPEIQGIVLNNLGSAHKLLQDWERAKDFLYRSINHNRAVQGDGAAVLAYSYFHLASVHHEQSKPDSTRVYALKSLILCQQNALRELQQKVQALLEQVRE